MRLVDHISLIGGEKGKVSSLLGVQPCCWRLKEKSIMAVRWSLGFCLAAREDGASKAAGGLKTEFPLCAEYKK